MYAAKYFSLMLPLFLVTISQSGCNTAPDAPELDLAPVSGTVMADGEPLANAVVMFVPNEGEAARSPFGTTDDSGNYELAYQGQPGCPPGKYRITISKFAQQDGSPFPADMPQEDQMAEGMEHVPAKYSSSEKTE